MSVISLPSVRHKHGSARVQAPCIGALETSAGRIRLTIFREFLPVRDHWLALQEKGVCVQAQSYTRAETWFRLVSAPAGAELALVCGRSDRGEMQFIWPFEVVDMKGIRCLRWIGCEHANYNMGLHTLRFARGASDTDIKKLLSEAASMIGGVHAAYLEKQPHEWDGVANPMALLPHRPGANTGHSILLDTDFDTLYRNRFSGKSRNTLGRKERRLRELGPVELGWAETPTQRRALLDAFFHQKAGQFSEQGIRDAFAHDSHRAFYHELAALPSGEPGTLEIGFLKVSGQIAAISSGIFFKDKFTTLLTSIDEGSVRKFSPGSLLLHFLIREACLRGLNFFDMGAGDARHKEEWCDVDTPLFENIIAFDERGYILTVPLATRAAVKRYIKTRPRLWALAQSVRRTVFGQGRKGAVPQDQTADSPG